MDGGPISKQLGRDETPTHLLTHGFWNDIPHLTSSGSNETGVRRIENGEIVKDSFELIQHNWRDWKLAGEVIKNRLAKGWNTDRISRLMSYIRENGLLTQPRGGE